MADWSPIRSEAEVKGETGVKERPEGCDGWGGGRGFRGVTKKVQNGSIITIILIKS